MTIHTDSVHWVEIRNVLMACELYFEDYTTEQDEVYCHKLIILNLFSVYCALESKWPNPLCILLGCTVVRILVLRHQRLTPLW